jgi:hypothetical protein
MDLEEAAAAWAEDGFVVLPEYLPPEDVRAAVSDLPALFPSGEDFHDGVDPGRNARFVGDELEAPRLVPRSRETPDTVTGVVERYPGLDIEPWRAALRGRRSRHTGQG